METKNYDKEERFDPATVEALKLHYAEILRLLGCRTVREGDAVLIDASQLTGCGIPDRLMREMRSSVIFLGALLARLGRAQTVLPGGCRIGARPIDLHLAGLVQMGACPQLEGERLLLTAPAGLHGADITLRFPSVGATETLLLAAALGRPWQDWKLVSAHGCACDPVAECMTERSVFFLTGGAETPATLCRKLTDAGMGEVHALVGENLGTGEEAIRYGSAAELAGQSFAPLSVLLVENFDVPHFRAPGFPDESFIRGQVPMTKQEVRAAALAKLAVKPADILWDVGAGTGSVSVELALAAPKGHVYAVECDPDACALIRQNRAKFQTYNLTLIEGRAPEALADLPAPDAVFIGGTKGGMEGVLDAVLAKNPDARICISAIALETLSAAAAALTARGLAAEVVQLAVSRTKQAGRLHLLMANNPIFLITGIRK